MTFDVNELGMINRQMVQWLAGPSEKELSISLYGITSQPLLLFFLIMS